MTWFMQRLDGQMNTATRPATRCQLLVAFDFNADHDHTDLLFSSSAWGIA
jgi:hypothetical protein